MKKGFTSYIFFILAMLVLICTRPCQVKASDTAKQQGIWLSYGDYKAAGLYEKSEAEFTSNADKLFKQLSEYKFDNIYFHVRAFDDAIYPSRDFKWSTFLSSKRLLYDPLKILVSKAHKYNIMFHAWINPYRITHEKILNPAKKSTIEHIVNGVKEIIERYDVDGIHFDDYFYPSKSKGNKYYSVSVKTRKENVNKMIKAVYTAVKETDPSVLFGISPAGNIEYAESIGCDIETWVDKKGYTDYIIPQLYWSDTYYSTRLDEWTSLCNYRKPMYIGLALYKAGLRSATDRGWSRSFSNIAQQYDMLTLFSCDGCVIFSYQDLFKPNGKKEFANYIKKISGMKISKSSLSLRKTATFDLKSILKIKKQFYPAVHYISSKPRVVSVSSKGVIKAKKAGVASVYISGLAGSTVLCKVKVR